MWLTEQQIICEQQIQLQFSRLEQDNHETMQKCTKLKKKCMDKNKKASLVTRSASLRLHFIEKVYLVVIC